MLSMMSGAIDHFGMGKVRVQCENPDAARREPKSYIVSVHVNQAPIECFENDMSLGACTLY